MLNMIAKLFKLFNQDDDWPPTGCLYVDDCRITNTCTGACGYSDEEEEPQ